jgi:hypothetical protein
LAQAEAIGCLPPRMSSGLGLTAEPSPFISLRQAPNALGLPSHGCASTPSVRTQLCEVAQQWMEQGSGAL